MTALKTFLDEIHPAVLWIFLLLSSGSGVTSYAGMVLMMGDAGFFWKAIAAILALCITAFIWLFWAHAWGIAPELRRTWQRLACVAIIFAGLACIVGISTASSVVGMSHKATEAIFFQQLSARAEQAIANGKGRAIGIDRALTGLHAMTDVFGGQADAEARGEGGGGVGCGVRCRNLKSVALGAGKLAESVAEEAKALTEHFEAADAALKELRDLAGKVMDPEDREAATSAVIVRLNAVLAQIETEGLVAAIHQGLAPLAESFVVAPPRNDVEHAAIDGIAAMVRARSRPILEEVERLRALPAIEPVVLDRPSPTQLVLRYWDALIIQICIGISLDAGPLLILLFRMLARDAIRRGDPGEGLQGGEHAKAARPDPTPADRAESADTSPERAGAAGDPRVDVGTADIRDTH